jgi:hypothetical protein
MYQWWLAEEQTELWRLNNRPFSDIERERAEVLEGFEAGGPSLFKRIVSVFTPRPHGPEPFIARTPEEAQLVASGVLSVHKPRR